MFLGDLAWPIRYDFSKHHLKMPKVVLARYSSIFEQAYVSFLMDMISPPQINETLELLVVAGLDYSDYIPWRTDFKEELNPMR